ncbi:MAG: FtsH protease activity modulator HflK [Alphaproteobacteria bacterium]|nr:FtsH protease activity modulator HflK [Alphaproteobacteria bacterium]
MTLGKDDDGDKGDEGPFKGPWEEADSERGRRTQDDTSKQSRGRKSDVPPSNPWARRDGSSSSNNGNNIDDFIDVMQERIRKIISGGGSSGRNFNGGSPRGSWSTAVFLTIGAVILWLGTGLYRVQEGEVGVVLRFGEMVRTSLPGLQYHLPAPFETVIVQKLDAVNTIESALQNERSGDSGDATLILTGDENMVHTNYTILWKIKDVSEYLFTTRNPEATIRVAAESVVREVIGQTTARLALTEGRGQIETRSQEILQKLLDQYKMGIQIISIQLQNVAPPHQVVDAFNDLQASLVNADQSRNEAEAYRNEVIPRAEGQAARIVNEAEAYSQRIIAEAEGEAARFIQVLSAYEQNAHITVKRYYLETMREVLMNTTKIILDEKTGKGMLPYLPLNELRGHQRNAAAEKGASK